MAKERMKKPSSAKEEKASKKKRPASEYNHFIKREMNAGKSMKEAAKAWKEHKEKKELSHMTEKNTHKHEHHEHAHHHETHHQGHSSGLEHELLKNLVALQKVNVDLAEKFDHLAKEISSLLGLFEVTAKSFAKSTPIGEYEKDKEFLDKIDRLLDQNKTLAKGLMLMEERLRERMYGPNPPEQQAQQKEKESFQPSIASSSRPLPRF